jgi:comEA protein
MRVAVGVCALALVTLMGLPQATTLSAAGQATGEVVTTQVNLNTASAADLERLPGVGPAMAARIVEYRQKNGNFKKIEDLMNVKGIGEKSFLKLKPQIIVTPPKVAER